MGILYPKELPNSSSKCKILASALKGTFSSCYHFGERISYSESEECTDIDFEDDHEVLEEVIRSRFMEAKLNRKTGLLSDSVSWAFFPTEGEVLVTPPAVQPREGNKHEEEDDFYSAESSFSRSSSAARRDDFFSMDANFSRSSTLKGLDFSDPWRRSVMQELCHCEGWPFGLCRKAVLLPPLPKCPSKSWSWAKGTKYA